MPEPTVCVVMPAHNAERFIGEALDSVLGQTRPPDEVLVADDASTDRTASIAREKGARVISLQVNRGAYVAVNAAIRASRAALIAHLDADDRWHPGHLEHLLALLARHPQAGVACSAMRHVGRRSGVWIPRALPDGVPADAFWPSFDRTVVPHNTSVIRRRVWEEAGGYEESRRMAMDFDFWLRCARRTLFVASYRVTADYRSHDGQISSRPLDQLASVYWSRLRLLETLEQEGERDLLGSARLRLLERWRDDMKAASWHREVERSQLLLKLSRAVPGLSARERGMWWLRSQLPEPVRRAGRRLRGMRKTDPASLEAAGAAPDGAS